ncbi:MAG: hypothetical protein WA906_01945 [Pacificimonas sp.]
MTRVVLILLMSVILAVPTFAREAAFEGEWLTMRDGAELRRAPLSSVLRGRTAWRTIYDTGGPRISDFSCLPPDYRRCVVTMGTGPEARLLEIDTETGRPVAGGFDTTATPLRADWHDDARLMVAGNTAPGVIDENGEPRLMQLWTRGTPLIEASTILATEPGTRDLTPIFDLSNSGLFHAATMTSPTGDDQLFHFGWNDNLVPSRLPAAFTFQDFFQGRAVALLGASWNGIPAGGLAAYPMAALLGPGRQTLPERAYVPAPGYGVEKALGGRDRLYVLLKGAGEDRLIDLRVGVPEWRERRLRVPGEGPIELLAVSKLAYTALVRRGGRLHAVGRGRTRSVSAP